MKVTRRRLLASAMAVPAVAGLASWQWKHGHGTVLLFDADMPEGRAFAEAGRAWNRSVKPIEGDRIRFARDIFARRPAIVQGVSRHADSILIEEVAAEAGYERAAMEVDGDAIKWTLMPAIRARG
jgi:hypothetical protein